MHLVYNGNNGLVQQGSSKIVDDSPSYHANLVQNVNTLTHTHTHTYIYYSACKLAVME
jgi:hypothetical protein